MGVKMERVKCHGDIMDRAKYYGWQNGQSQVPWVAEWVEPSAMEPKWVEPSAMNGRMGRAKYHGR